MYVFPSFSSLNAFVASRTQFEKSIESFASFFAISLKRSFFSPSSDTPESSAPWIDFFSILMRVAFSLAPPHDEMRISTSFACSLRRFDCEILSDISTIFGWNSSSTLRQASEFITDVMCESIPHVSQSGRTASLSRQLSSSNVCGIDASISATPFSAPARSRGISAATASGVNFDQSGNLCFSISSLSS